MIREARIRVGQSQRRPDFVCRACGYVCDAVTGLGSEPPVHPTAGSVSLCIQCGDLAIFLDEAPWLRAPTDEERRVCDEDPELQRIRDILRQAIAERSPL